jgi:hypothetical protein
MHLGVFVLGTGNHIAGWRYPGAADSFLSLEGIQTIAATAERGTSSSIWWFPSSRRTACTGANTKATRCATISACPGRPT